MTYNVNYPLELNGLVELLEAKGYHEPDAIIRFRSLKSYTQIRLEFDYKARPDGLRTYKSISMTDTNGSMDPRDYFTEARKMIAALPTVREALIKEFVNQLEDVKQKAADLEIDVDMVNPLAELMAKLATNALTHIKS